MVDKKKIAVWGSSTFQYMHPYFRQLAYAFEVRDIFLGGKGGEEIDATAARIGAIPLKLKVPAKIVPKNGPSEVIVMQKVIDPDIKAFSGILNGVHGVLKYSIRSSTKYFFVRSKEGEAVHCPDYYEFMPDSLRYRDAMVLINVGKNNLSRGNDDVHSSQYVLSRTRQICDWLPTKKFIVVGHFVNSNSSAVNAGKVHDLNYRLKTTYGERFFDIQDYLMSSEVWSDISIAPTLDDINDQITGVLARSLSRDPQHLNESGSKAVTDRLGELMIRIFDI
ncbi:MAG TPA: hypothetical protein DD666_09525 [Advenella kashmirensis]|uniref:SGNH/GDSL hydrolase family protein n=1 Tax=Advenella kashmirensis TaxID=310575 RepID=A0A356LGE0_9BURK|nr:hypothetical protein [Advenella kashmirensis]